MRSKVFGIKQDVRNYEEKCYRGNDTVFDIFMSLLWHTNEKSVTKKSYLFSEQHFYSTDLERVCGRVM